MVITDLNLPGLSAELLTEYIKKERDIPVIMLTAKNKVEQIVKGFSIGAYDYISKPFDTKELLARVNNLMKRYNSKHLFKNINLIIYKNNNTVLVNSIKVELTHMEYKIKELLCSNPNIILSRGTILNSINSDSVEINDRVVDTHIKEIRKKISDDINNPLCIKTIYGGGTNL